MTIDVPGVDPPLPAALFADKAELFDRSFLPGINGDYRTHLAGQTEFNATIIDKASGGGAYTVILWVKVEWEGRVYEQGFSGRVLGGN